MSGNTEVRIPSCERMCVSIALAMIIPIMPAQRSAIRGCHRPMMSPMPAISSTAPTRYMKLTLYPYVDVKTSICKSCAESFKIPNITYAAANKVCMMRVVQVKAGAPLSVKIGYVSLRNLTNFIQSVSARPQRSLLSPELK